MIRLQLGAAAALCSLGLSCARPAQQNVTRATTAAVPSNPVRSANPGEPSREPAPRDAAAEATVARALGFVARLRELEPMGPVKGRTISRPEMVSRVERSLDTDLPPAVVEASGEILFALGTVPASFDYRRGLLEVMRSELLGFYEPHEKTLFIGADLQGQELDATLWHELVHALQDQHYGLEKLLTWADDAGDWQAAVHALAEGDATSAMIDALFADKHVLAPDLSDQMFDLQSALSAGSVSHVPPIIARSVVAPYVDGLAFVNALRRRGGWSAVAGAWQRLPASTEQVLHLAKYDSGERPEPLPALALSATGPSRVTYSDVYGEETLRILFEEWMPARAARDAAQGWAGDRVSSFADGQSSSVAWRIRYDSEAAALNGFHAFARGALAAEDQPLDTNGHLSPFVSADEATRASRTGQLCRERHIRGPFAVIHHEREIALTLGPFRRNSGSARSEGHCADALKWASALLTQPKSPD